MKDLVIFLGFIFGLIGIVSIIAIGLLVFCGLWFGCSAGMWLALKVFITLYALAYVVCKITTSKEP